MIETTAASPTSRPLSALLRSPRCWLALEMAIVLVAGAMLGVWKLETTADSPSYVRTSNLPLREALTGSRTLGYPLLLKVVSVVSPDYHIIPWIHLAMLFATVWFLDFSVRRFGASPWHAFAVSSGVLFGSLPLRSPVTELMTDFPSLMLAVVAVSGGMDSCVTAAIANENYELAFAHINYGQRTELRELKAFNDIANFYKVSKRLVIDYTHLAKIGGSSLTDNNIEVSKADLDNKEIPSSYVPFRNSNILSACTSWAEVLNACAIFIGAVWLDNFIRRGGLHEAGETGQKRGQKRSRR